MSSKSGMDKILGTIHFVTKLLSVCELVKPDASKIQFCGGHWIDILIPKGRNWKKVTMGPKQVSNQQSKFHYILRFVNNSLWLQAPSSKPTNRTSKAKK